MNRLDLPKSAAIEQRVLACEIERGNDALITVLENGIKLSDFADPLCQQIQEAIMQLHATALPFGMSDLWERFQIIPEVRNSLIEITKGHEDRDMMILSRICAELRELSRRRKMMTLSQQLSKAAANEPEAMPGIMADLLAIQSDTVKSRSWSKICDAATLRAEDVIAGRSNAANSISWGYPQIDQRFKKMHKGEFVILAARPSIGKSSLARGIATAAAIDNRRVLFESLEVSPDDVLDGMATSHSGLNAAELASVPAKDQKQFLLAIATLRTAPLQICEDRTLAGIIARTKACNAQAPLDLLLIDYIGLIADCEPAKGQNKAQAVGNVTKALKRLAMELKIVVIGLAQLNRQSITDGNREPRLSDLRDSGDLEQDADRVILIHRPDECPISKRRQDSLDDLENLPRYGCALIQAKGRNVGTGYGAVWFNRRLARFEFDTSRTCIKAA